MRFGHHPRKSAEEMSSNYGRRCDPVRSLGSRGNRRRSDEEQPGHLGVWAADTPLGRVVVDKGAAFGAAILEA
jgi:hypothetical protein